MESSIKLHYNPKARKQPFQPLATALLCCLLTALGVAMLLQHDLFALFLSVGCSLAANDNCSHSNASYGLQCGGLDAGARSWFVDFEDTLATMQDTYWNGTYWPTSIQWIGAFLDTLLAASDRSFTSALKEHTGNAPGAYASTTSIQSKIQKYYSQIEAYYSDEDTIQIFGAAYDDAQWVVLEWLEVIKFIYQYDAYASDSLGQSDISRFAHRAHIFYNIVQNQFNTSLCDGGLTWNPALAPYKNAITNELFVASSIGMYLYYPGDNDSDPYPSPYYKNVTNSTLPALPALAAHDPLLLENAQREYEWFKTHNFTNEQGLVVDGFHISDYQTTCNERNEMVYTYNSGVLLSGLRGLWDATGDMSYLTDGYSLVDAVINATGWYAKSSSQATEWAGLGRNGIMEDYCDAPANCSQDNQIFKGIYFHHLGLFCEPLPTKIPLVAGLTELASTSLASEHADKCASYIPWIEHNARAALSTRDSSGIIGGWWGASYVNKTQAPWPQYAVPMPRGSTDVWNSPSVLNSPPWACQGSYCHKVGMGNPAYGIDTVFRRRRSVAQVGRTDVNNEGRGRTVETEGSGFAVVKAAGDSTLKRPAV